MLRSGEKEILRFWMSSLSLAGAVIFVSWGQFGEFWEEQLKQDPEPKKPPSGQLRHSLDPPPEQVLQELSYDEQVPPEKYLLAAVQQPRHAEDPDAEQVKQEASQLRHSTPERYFPAGQPQLPSLFFSM